MKNPSPARLALLVALACSAACAVDPEPADLQQEQATRNLPAPEVLAPVRGEEAGVSAPLPRKPIYTGPRTAFVHLFEWRWEDVAFECEHFLGPRGFAAVQVSPPQEHAVFSSGTWWQRYQPVSYRLESRSGTRAEFASMVARCKAAGVHIYVDAVMNHMSFQESGTGIAGTKFTKYAYPGLYSDEHFHRCRRGIVDYGSRSELHWCELATCADLDTGHEEVRNTLAAYLQDLVDLGVAGIRVDGAKHISTVDLDAILSRVQGPLYVYQEMIDYDGKGPVTALEHTAIGDVTEFRYGADLSRVFRTGKLSWLSSFGEGWGYLPSDRGIAFIDNHDNQRGHGAGDPLTHRDGALYRLANIFMLAFPYGYPQLMSSYAFEGGDDGPPADAAMKTKRAIDSSTGECTAGWLCEHRTPAVASMLGFRNATSGAFQLTDWWDDGDRRIAFGRGALGFIVINGHRDATMARRFTTTMPAGEYCDVVGGEPLATGGCSGREITVRHDGTFEATVGPLDAIAIHHVARPTKP